MPTTMFGRQPRAVLPPSSAPEMAPAMKPTTIQPMRLMSSMASVSHGQPVRRRKSRTASTTASGWVWWAACRAPGMTTIRPSARRASSATVASRNTGRLVAAEDLEDRLADRAERARATRPGSALRLELAHDRRRGRDPERPDRVGPVARPGRPSLMPTTRRHERREQRRRGRPAARSARSSLVEPGGVVARRRAASGRPRTRRPGGSAGVRSAAPSAHRPP